MQNVLKVWYYTYFKQLNLEVSKVDRNITIPNPRFKERIVSHIALVHNDKESNFDHDGSSSNDNPLNTSVGLK